MKSRLTFIADGSTVIDQHTHNKYDVGVFEKLKEIQQLKLKNWVSLLVYDDFNNYWKIICIKEKCENKIFTFHKNDFTRIIKNAVVASKLNEAIYDYMQMGDDIITDLIKGTY